jgi:hypothetical protein
MRLSIFGYKVRALVYVCLHTTMINFVDSLSRWTDEALIQKADLLRDVQSLVLYGRAVSDYGLKVLERCAKLRELHLVETSVTDKGLGYLKELRSLRWLSIDDASVTDSGIIQLRNLHQLEGLQLVKTRVSDDGLEILLHFPKLEYLEISGCTIAEKGVLFISRVSSLNSLRLAAPTIFDDSFLSLSYCTQLSKFAFDMPLVTTEAIDQLQLRLPGCAMNEYYFFRPEEKVIYLVSNFMGEGKTILNLEKALVTADELLSYSPYHPALHGARAFIHYRLGNITQFRNDLQNVRDNANIYGQSDLRFLAMQYLSFDSHLSLQAAMKSQHPDRYIANHLLTTGVRQPLRKEPVAGLLHRMNEAAQVKINAYETKKAPGPDPFSTPLYRHPQVIVNLSGRPDVIPSKEWKDELKKVPWNW